MNEEFESKKLSLNNNEQFMSTINNPVVKVTILSVLKSVPIIGDLVDSTIDIFLANFQNQKREELIQIILSDITITPEMVNDVEFIMNFAKTLEAINKLATNDKIVYFANLLKNSYFSGNKIDNNEFEEFFEVINSLSYRQIRVLIILHNIENDPEPHIDNTMSKNDYLPRRYWFSFKKELKDKLNIEQEDVYSIMKSMEQTGLFTMNNGFSYDAIEEGTLTPYFKKFAKWVLALSCGNKA
jgi:hypothetical protein